jgi:hypothetical protein
MSESAPPLEKTREQLDRELEAELDRVFDHHPPPANVVPIHEGWRALLKSVAQNLMTLPPTRERACAMTKLEECMFWTNACIARNHGAFARMAEAPTPTEEVTDESG